MPAFGYVNNIQNSIHFFFSLLKFEQ